MNKLHLKQPMWLYTLIAGASLSLLICCFFTINVSPSMPQGLYLKEHLTAIHLDDIVLVCPSNTIAKLGLKRQYLLPGWCPSHTAPLVKKVVAMPGDDVIVTRQGIWVNGVFRLMPTHQRDEKGRLLPAISRGSYLHTNGYWLAGIATNSWDSRYWGPVNASLIKAKVTYIPI